MTRHGTVTLLGAGASAEAGYPVATQLRPQNSKGRSPRSNHEDARIKIIQVRDPSWLTFVFFVVAFSFESK
jgi:hypothetical protein